MSYHFFATNLVFIEQIVLVKSTAQGMGIAFGEMRCVDVIWDSWAPPVTFTALLKRHAMARANACFMEIPLHANAQVDLLANNVSMVCALCSVTLYCASTLFSCICIFNNIIPACSAETTCSGHGLCKVDGDCVCKAGYSWVNASFNETLYKMVGEGNTCIKDECVQCGKPEPMTIGMIMTSVIAVFVSGFLLIVSFDMIFILKSQLTTFNCFVLVSCRVCGHQTLSKMHDLMH
jgi:hypothetical protein